MNCPKCNRIKRGQIKYFDEEVKQQRKRYGSELCADCMVESLGGQEQYEKMKKERILNEMK